MNSRPASLAEQFVQAFHDRRPGTTSAAFKDIRAVRRGRHFSFSYACLTDLVAHTHVLVHVLDVGCGDGHLLSTLAQRLQKNLQLTGVDISLGEVRIARNRLGTAATLRHERVQSMSLTTGSIDVVVSHLSLMLMDDLDLVLSEIHRVLRPGGIFSAVIGSSDTNNAILDIWVSLLRPFMAQAREVLPKLGDPRTRSGPELRAVLQPLFESIKIDEILLSSSTTPHDLYVWLAGTYDVEVLSASATKQLKGIFLNELAKIYPDGDRLEFTYGLRQVTAHARRPL